MIRLTLLLLASIAVVMIVAGEETDPRAGDPRNAAIDVARSGNVPTELAPSPNRLALDDEEGAIARALAAGAAPRVATPPMPRGSTRQVPQAEKAVETRHVEGDRVNMRAGPGTTFDVIGRLQRGDAVEIVEDPGDGWVRLRAARTGQTGWVADFLLSAGG